MFIYVYIHINAGGPLRDGGHRPLPRRAGAAAEASIIYIYIYIYMYIHIYVYVYIHM